jgi:hypothetical protein
MTGHRIGVGGNARPRANIDGMGKAKSAPVTDADSCHEKRRIT